MLLLFFHVVYLLSFLQSNRKHNQMHNCEDGDENESVSLDAALSAASKNQGNLLKGNDNKTVRRLGAIFILRKDIRVGGPENGNFPLLYIVKMSLRRWVGG